MMRRLFATTTALLMAGLLVGQFQSCSGKESDDDSDDDKDEGPTVTLKGSSLASSFMRPGNLDAGVMKFNVYKFAVSESVTCSDPIVVWEDEDGVEKDMLDNPTFGSGALKEGEYPCVMIELSKVIKTAAATTSGNCTTTEFNDVICQSDNQDSLTIDGEDVSCTGGATNDQHVTLYITTLSAGSSGARALLPPSSETDTASGLKLTSAFVVDGDTTATFKVDPTNFLQSYDSPAICATSAPTFGFE
jgi:hypothetical protein